MKAIKQQGIIVQKQSELQTQEQHGDNKPKSIMALINDPDMQKQFAKALPAVITPERFTRIVLTAIRNTPKLRQCDPMSFFAAVMSSAQLGLEPNTPLGQAYLIPYGSECEFQIGYKGLIDLAYRSGEVSIIQAHTVHENDEFIYELGLEAKLIHKPLMKGDRGETIAYYAIFKMKNGGENFAVMSKDDVLKFAKAKSKAFKNGPWQTDFDSMAKKTVLKKVLKYAPIHSESVATAMQNDERTMIFVDKDSGEVMAKEIDITEADDEPTPEDLAEAMAAESADMDANGGQE